MPSSGTSGRVVTGDNDVLTGYESLEKGLNFSESVI